MSKGGFMKDAFVLCGITLVAGALLGGVYEMTKAPIDAANLAAKEAAYRTVFPDAASFDAGDLADKIPAANEEIAGLGYGKVMVDEAVAASDASGAAAGYVVTATSNDGFGGAITVSVGIQSDGTVNGIEFLTLAETAGLGMRANTDAFKDQFKDKNVDKFEYTKTGATADDQIDALSGATITTNAMTNGVNAGLCAFQYEKGGNQ